MIAKFTKLAVYLQRARKLKRGKEDINFKYQYMSQELGVKSKIKESAQVVLDAHRLQMQHKLDQLQIVTKSEMEMVRRLNDIFNSHLQEGELDFLFLNEKLFFSCLGYSRSLISPLLALKGLYIFRKNNSIVQSSLLETKQYTYKIFTKKLIPHVACAGALDYKNYAQNIEKLHSFYGYEFSDKNALFFKGELSSMVLKSQFVNFQKSLVKNGAYESQSLKNKFNFSFSGHKERPRFNSKFSSLGVLQQEEIFAAAVDEKNNFLNDISHQQSLAAVSRDYINFLELCFRTEVKVNAALIEKFLVNHFFLKQLYDWVGVTLQNQTLSVQSLNKLVKDNPVFMTDKKEELKILQWLESIEQRSCIEQQVPDAKVNKFIDKRFKV